MRSSCGQGRGNPRPQGPPRGAAALLCAAAATLLLPAAGDARGATVPFPVVLTQVPLRTGAPGPDASGGMRPPEWEGGARIVLVAPGAGPRLLAPGFHAAADPEISFDGTRMLFAGRRAASDPWDIFETPIEGGEARRITSGLGDCRHPIYLGTTFTLDSPEPWELVAFVSTAAGEIGEHGGGLSTSLYTARLDGTEIQRITYNPSGELTPTTLPDGRILFSSWQRSTLDRGERGRISLFASQTDGLDFGIFSGDEGQRIKHMPAVTPSRRVVFVESESLPWDGAGRLASVSLRRNLRSHEPISDPGDGLFHSPSPLPDGRLLVSRRPASDEGTHGVLILDPASGAIEPLFDDPAWHDVQAKLVAPRPEPDGRSTGVTPGVPTGAFYGLNVYQSDLGGDWIEPGTPVRLRVLEGIPQREGGPRPERVEGDPPLLQRRFLGEIPVEKDGSFHVQVPAGTPIQLQLVDEEGMALRSCGWIWVRNRESRGCIGCHESGEMTPENRFVDALHKPAWKLTLPPERRRTVDFRRDVAPILGAKCAVAACHGGDGATPILKAGRESVERAFTNLMHRPEGWSGSGSPWAKYVHPGSARTSPLISSLYGREVARPWDRNHDPCVVPPMPPLGWDPLTEDEKRTLVEWIDLGALWDGIPEGSIALPAPSAGKSPPGESAAAGLAAEGEAP